MFKSVHYFTFTRLLCLLTLTLLPLSSYASQPPVVELLWGYLTPQNPVYHQNGSLAWNGIRQEENFQKNNVFYHVDGSIAWDGMKRTIDTWGTPSAKGVFYYDNGQEAWGGIPQKLNTWGSPHKQGVFYHSNGVILWSGVKQKLDTWGSAREDAKFFHSNGTEAWGGLKQRVDRYGNSRKEGNLYYSNGQLAWSGLKASAVYDSTGKMITHSADYVILNLDNDCWLYVDYSGNYRLTLNIGEGYKLMTSDAGVSLQLYNLLIPID